LPSVSPCSRPPATTLQARKKRAKAEEDAIQAGHAVAHAEQERAAMLAQREHDVAAAKQLKEKEVRSLPPALAPLSPLFSPLSLLS